jgi:preprotein translocase subunit YajC
LGLGTTTTSVLFLVAILVLVVYLTLTRRDEIRPEDERTDVDLTEDLLAGDRVVARELAE